jgi:hypothetical protein
MPKDEWLPTRARNAVRRARVPDTTPPPPSYVDLWKRPMNNREIRQVTKGRAITPGRCIRCGHTFDVYEAAWACRRKPRCNKCAGVLRPVVPDNTTLDPEK